MKKWLLFLTVFLTVSLVLAGCGETEKEKAETDSNQHLTAYTTVYPLQFFTEEIGGDLVNVETIYPPGADEHTFEPSQKDMIKLAESDLFIYVGLGLEGFVEKAKDSLKNEKVTMVAAGESIHFDEDNHSEEEGHEEEHADEHHHGDRDPHVWLDPIFSKELAESIKDALIEKDPENEATYAQNYNALIQRLDELDTQFLEMAEQAEHKEFIVSHAAYGYWEHRYGLEQISISGLSTSSEPSQKDLESIVKTAKEINSNYIFFEQNVSSKLTEIVQEEIGAEALTLHNLSVRTEEDMKKNRDYFSIMNDNLQALKKALH
ncbi:metal ABC transporter solute-binding protein, Zn/Mn family [Niallia endozanthoxylica]|uniref:Adhesin n=1 Tax=Niallia endozanthoxylica TaxID=2036016 RepID=A0A5J5GWV5_9BACI|nr:zinc ABC transporter substrate-binding protein [Niallia endozanthoxylica]KAA9012675.1 adhesin [Niallia endozanthoxylica]